MKFFTGLLALTLSVASFASTGESKTFTYDGSQDSVELLLKGEKTHTEYRIENIPSTCYRQAIVGYRTICTGGGYGPGPGYPRPYPGPYYPRPYPRHCFQEPIYRSIPYTCIRTVRTPFEVKDFDVDAKVILNVSALVNEGAKEKFTVSLIGDKLTILMNGSKRFIGVLKTEAVNEQMAGSVKIMDAKYAVELVDASAVNSAIAMKGLTVKNGVLVLKATAGASRSDVAVALKVVKKKVLADDIVLIDRTLNADESRIEKLAGDVMIDLAALGVQLNGGKYSITAKLFFNGGRVLNRVELPALETSRTLIYKN